MMNDIRVTEKEASDWLRAGRDFSSGGAGRRSIRFARSLIDIRFALAAAGILGRASSRLSLFGPSPDEIAKFLGGSCGANWRGISREITASAAKNMVLRSFVGRKGIEGLAPFVRISGAEYLYHLNEKNLPAVLLFGHNGPTLGILGGLFQLNIPVLVIRRDAVPYPVPPNISFCITEGKVRKRALALKLAIDRLRAGGMVLLALWGRSRPREGTLEFMGRNTYFTPGFAAAARLSGAPVIPVSSGWARGRQFIELHFSDPLTQPGCSPEAADIFDRSLINEAAQWLEAGLRSVPGQIQLNQLRSFLGTTDKKTSG